jgi:hypothetical protein
MGWSFRVGDISGLGDHLGHGHETAFDDLLGVVVSEDEPTGTEGAAQVEIGFRRRTRRGTSGEEYEGS